MNRPSPRPALRLAADWVEGRLAPEDADRAAERAVSDPVFRAEVQFVRMVVAAGRDLPLVDPPPVLRQRLRQSFQQWHRAPSCRPTRVLEVVASLVFDSRRHQLGLATRGAAAGMDGDAVHLMWHCELADLMVEARATDEAGLVDLRGQVLLSHDSGSPVFTAEVTGPDHAAVSVDADDLGRFSVLAPRSASELRVSNGEMAIVAEIELHIEESS
ncbi:hypothetical protein I601_3449 [Nocardioides dokdonensis FR1436]|uniref:Uncharacterized protein n=1 Tax=Nocardioides dokdonensis FR1436 TaxID=1300347 RepID=A0A1A9GQY8_9ACTN|nr:hypothetical protein [Nocardioides dokdonensis]ANH39855.1 hypothetical protein I601_3449 [Nocardioides dokdonensis FR1436]